MTVENEPTKRDFYITESFASGLTFYRSNPDLSAEQRQTIIEQTRYAYLVSAVGIHTATILVQQGLLSTK